MLCMMIRWFLYVASDVSSIEETMVVDSVVLSDDEIMATFSFKVSQQSH